MAETVNVRHFLPHPETVLPKILTSYDNFFFEEPKLNLSLIKACKTNFNKKVLKLFQNPGSGLSNMAETVNVRHILPHPETVLPKTLTSYDNFF